MPITDPLLRIPACITAEDDDHVVISLRVEKKWFAENARFLAALLDLGISEQRDKFDQAPYARKRRA